MFFRLFAFLAVVAVAFANPKPEPQVVAYSGGAFPYNYPGYSAFGYSAPYAAFPYAYNGYFAR